MSSSYEGRVVDGLLDLVDDGSAVQAGASYIRMDFGVTVVEKAFIRIRNPFEIYQRRYLFSVFGLKFCEYFYWERGRGGSKSASSMV